MKLQEGLNNCLIIIFFFDENKINSLFKKFQFLEPPKDASSFLKTVSKEAKDILDELNKDYKAPETSNNNDNQRADKFNAVRKIILYPPILESDRT